MKTLQITKLYNLSDILREERIRQHKTQRDISKKSSISMTMIGMVETGKSTPGIETLASWAGALGYDEIQIKIH